MKNNLEKLTEALNKAQEAYNAERERIDKEEFAKEHVKYLGKWVKIFGNEYGRVVGVDGDTNFLVTIFYQDEDSDWLDIRQETYDLSYFKMFHKATDKQVAKIKETLKKQLVQLKNMV